MALIKLKSNAMNPQGWHGNEEVEVSHEDAVSWQAKGWCDILNDVEAPVVEPVVEEPIQSAVDNPVEEPVEEVTEDLKGGE